MPKPLLFITGFLGAGKTTLLRALLQDLKALDRAADVILNDYENAEIDASTLQGRAESIFPIAASCACCGSLDDLVKLCITARETEGKVLLIELNGTADPLPLLEAFTLLEDSLPYAPRWQIGVVDARHWGRRGAFAALERRQVETATHWMLTHSENLSTTAIADIAAAVREINPYATQVKASQLLAADLVAERDAVDKAQKASPGSPRELSQSGASHRGHALAHQFTGHQIAMPDLYRRDQIIELLQALPEEVIRAKALVKLEDVPGSRWLFERTGHHPIEPPAEVEGLGRAPESLVCIGPSLNPEKLEALVKEHLNRASSTL